MVYTYAWGAYAARRGGSTPLPRTREIYDIFWYYKFYPQIRWEHEKGVRKKLQGLPVETAEVLLGTGESNNERVFLVRYDTSRGGPSRAKYEISIKTEDFFNVILIVR